MIKLEDITLKQREKMKTPNNIFKSKILNSFSHELRTPLNFSINMLERFLRTMDNGVEKNIKEIKLNSSRQRKISINDSMDDIS